MKNIRIEITYDCECVGKAEISKEVKVIRAHPLHTPRGYSCTVCFDRGRLTKQLTVEEFATLVKKFDT